MIVNTRKDLNEYFSQALFKKEELDEEKEPLEIKPKSFIIESNVEVKKALNNGWWAIKETNDKDLLRLVHKSNTEFFLDTLDKRFWIFHSLGPSDLVTKIIYSLVVKNNSKLDFIWLSSGFLEELREWGKQTAFGLKFNNKFLKNDETEIEQVSMRFWGGPAKEIIDDLRGNDNIKQAIALSNLGLKYSPSGKGYVKDNISYMGRFTIRKGDSIEPHFNLLSRIKEKYSKIVKDVEENYRLSYSGQKTGISMKGDFVFIKFPHPIPDLKLFLDVITSCRMPFRMWGVWSLIEKDYAKANCVDLHSGNKLNIELSEEWMRVYLEDNACGNVITRLFTNLQQFFNSEIKLYGLENERIM